MTFVQEFAWRERVREEERSHKKLESELLRLNQVRRNRILRSQAAGARAPTPPTTLAWINATLHTPSIKEAATRKAWQERKASSRDPLEAMSRPGSIKPTRPQSAYESPNWRLSLRGSESRELNRKASHADLPTFRSGRNHEWEHSILLARAMRNPQALRSRGPTPWR